jgi:2-methylcitrate dehydratase
MDGAAAADRRTDPFVICGVPDAAQSELLVDVWRHPVVHARRPDHHRHHLGDALHSARRPRLQLRRTLFKISFPAEFHAQTACEAAVILHPQVRDRLHEIDKIVITTHESAIRIISKVGTLANPADRDHCIQYMTAVPLAFGNLVAEQYEDDFHAAHPIIDELREKMEIVEDPRYTREYLEADKRSIANSVQVFFKDGSSTTQVAVEYPVGHRRRRAEGIALLEGKFKANLATRFSAQRSAQIFHLCTDQAALEATPVQRFMDMWVM